jgi:hypothetical protein
MPAVRRQAALLFLVGIPVSLPYLTSRVMLLFFS